MLPAMQASPIPTSTSTTMPMTTNPTRASTLWPSMVPVSANLFVTRQWLMTPTQENDQTSPKQENVLVRKVTITISSAMGGPTSANNLTAATVTQFPEKRSKKCKSSCTISAKLATQPSPANTNWLEEYKYYYPHELKHIPSCKRQFQF